MLNQSIESEQSVIGACILSEEAYDCVADKLKPEDFSLINHQLIYRAISELRDDGDGVDIVTVNAKLSNVDPDKQASFLSSDESLAYLAGVEDATPSAANVESYAEVVKNHSVSRKLKAAAEEIRGIADEPIKASEKTASAAAIIEEVAKDKTDSNSKDSRQIMIEVVEELEKAWATDGAIIGLSTGFEHVDTMTSGLQKADLFILAGRPSQGKSAIAMNIAQYVGKTDPVLVFSLEMSAAAMGQRMISSIGGLDFSKIRNGQLRGMELDVFGATTAQIKNYKLTIDDSAGISIDQLRAKARVHDRKHGCKLIVVDYLQLLTGKGENMTTQLGYISQGLKALAKELDCPVLALSQLNRSLAGRSNKRPEMTDLRGSGNIEQDADVIAFIHLEKKYDEETYLGNLGELIIKKQRQGQTGTIYLEEQLDQMRYVTNHNAIPEKSDEKAAAKKKAEEDTSAMLDAIPFAGGFNR